MWQLYEVKPLSPETKMNLKFMHIQENTGDIKEKCFPADFLNIKQKYILIAKGEK